jgi:hypothetical protein
MPAAADAAYRGCEVRPLDLCRLPDPDDPGEFSYVDGGPHWHDGACPDGDLIHVAETHAKDGEVLSTACVEYSRELWQVFKIAFFSAICTLPVCRGAWARVTIDQFRHLALQTC